LRETPRSSRVPSCAPPLSDQTGERVNEGPRCPPASWQLRSRFYAEAVDPKASFEFCATAADAEFNSDIEADDLKLRAAGREQRCVGRAFSLPETLL